MTNRLAILLVRDLRLLIALRLDSRRCPSRLDPEPIGPGPAAVRQLPPRHRAAVQEPRYFDIAAREVQAPWTPISSGCSSSTTMSAGQMLIEIQLNDGEVMDVLVPHVRLTFGSSFATCRPARPRAGAVRLAIWFMHRELVPIQHLGVAADALGKGRDIPDFAFSGGTREVRNAATAFHTMRIRLRRSIQQRTEMLAGVSHDLHARRSPA